MQVTRAETKYYTEVTPVDIETGEIITKSHIDRQEYLIINISIRYEYDNEKNICTRKITWNCKRNQQQKLQFD